MDFRAAVAVHLCLLVAGASCGVIRDDTKEALNSTAQLLRTEMQPLLKSLQSAFGPFSNSSCRHLNGTELGEPEERPLTRAHLSSFRCYTVELSKNNQTSIIRRELDSIGQGLDSMVRLLDSIGQRLDSMVRLLDSTVGKEPVSDTGNCSLPDLKTHFDLFQYVGCLLQRLDHRLRNPTF